MWKLSHLPTYSNFFFQKNPSHEKVRHSILAFLDSSVPKKINLPPQDYVSPNKISKAFSLTSVISNVKSKALSLVKSNDNSSKDKRKSLNAEVAKRVMSILNTPPDSVPSSPGNKYNYVSTEPQSEHNPGQKQNLSTNKNRGTILENKSEERTTNSGRRPSVLNSDSDIEANESDHKYYKAKVIEQSTKSIENLIKSPARRPLSANSDYNQAGKKYSISDEHLIRSQSVTNVSNPKSDISIEHNISHKDDSSDIESAENNADEEPPNKDNLVNNTKQTKGVLKNASSTSSLNKKKVLFDMDAIQMKSLSASPSQSLTEKSDGNEKYELGLINLDGEEWDISR